MKGKKLNGKTIALIAALAVAVCLLFVGTIGVTRSALNPGSATYNAELSMKSVNAALNENGVHLVDDSTLLTGVLGEDESLVIGKKYSEVLSVTNTNSEDVDEYVRLTIYKYWEDDEGKRTDLSPELIKLTLGSGKWLIDAKSSTKERMVLYYSEPLAFGDTTEDAITALTVDGKLAKMVTQDKVVDGKYTTITTSYVYNGLNLGIKAEVDAVQAHNAEDAILSAWGANVSIGADGTLSLN
jgi:hypothetical protein